MKKKLPKQQKNKTTLFPKIYRFITERWKLIVAGLASSVIVVGIILQSISLYQNIQKERETARERGQVEKELTYWKKSLIQYKDSRDIYFKIAVLEYRLGNAEEAKLNLDKMFEIDPNFEKGREMEKQLGL